MLIPAAVDSVVTQNFSEGCNTGGIRVTPRSARRGGIGIVRKTSDRVSSSEEQDRPKTPSTLARLLPPGAESLRGQSETPHADTVDPCARVTDDLVRPRPFRPVENCTVPMSRRRPMS